VNMKISLYLTPGLVDEQALREKIVVAIDVLRASTTMITALKSGAREIVPATTIESAVKIAANLDAHQTILGGERHGRIIEGFQLGNSPGEYTEERVKGKTIVFTTTNGSQAVVRSRYARELIVCGFVNLTVVRDHLVQKPSDIAVICAGRNGDFSMEDTVCAGMLVSMVSEGATEPPVLCDAAAAALVLYRSLGKSLLTMMEHTDHGRYLQEIDMGDDLRVCAAVDAVPVLPVYEGNVLRLRKTDTTEPPAR